MKASELEAASIAFMQPGVPLAQACALLGDREGMTAALQAAAAAAKFDFGQVAEFDLAKPLSAVGPDKFLRYARLALEGCKTAHAFPAISHACRAAGNEGQAAVRRAVAKALQVAANSKAPPPTDKGEQADTPAAPERRGPGRPRKVSE